ncbi:hypothetical protein D9758_016030 [Tetrapyrgos nigripes]|uniref:Helicase C-terminal domain-containing protein n=1 Tax=Tetrapyrgos nigripes TaxID=182062 RepID=A0A8H5C9S5_9AGAR|nr:hypothetical protein D9758_016030 [Tetrapyrgos nigripes]
MPRSSSVPVRSTTARKTFKRHISLPAHFTNEPMFITFQNPALTANTAEALAGAMKPETHHRQELAVLEFTNWGNNMGFHTEDLLPVNENILVEFTASFKGQLAGGTVKAKLSAIKTWHLTLGFPWRGSELLRCTLTGIEHLAPASSHHPEHPPVTHDMMRSLHAAFSQSDKGIHKAASTGSKLGFLGQLCLGELFPRHSDPHLFEFKKHSRVLDAVELPPPICKHKYGSIDLFLPGTKTEGCKGDRAHITPFKGSLNAIKATHAHNKGLVCLYSAGYSNEYCEEVMAQFKAGKVQVLICTDAAGMGCNIPDIQVINRWLL